MTASTPSGGTSVMARRVEPHDSLDDFPTQPWGTRALVEHVLIPHSVKLGRAWEPACNRGHMAQPLREYFDSVHASDIFDYGEEWSGQERVVDFLWPNSESPKIARHPVDWIISNPPFKLAEQFIARGRGLATVGCAMLVRTSFLEGVGRYERLYNVTPPSIIAQFVERLPMVKGRIDRKVSTATSYAWLVWIKDCAPRPFQWIPPCRARLDRDSDWPQAIDTPVSRETPPLLPSAPA